MQAILIQNALASICNLFYSRQNNLGQFITFSIISISYQVEETRTCTNRLRRTVHDKSDNKFLLTYTTSGTCLQYIPENDSLY